MKQLVNGMKITGTREFVDRTRAALELLHECPTYQIVRPFLRCICELPFSGLVANWGRPFFRVGERTWRAPLEWYASAIVHDAGHAKLFFQNRRRLLWIDFTSRETWTGKKAERYCLRLQLDALRELGADENMQEYVKTLWKNPKYQLIAERTW